MDGKHGVLSSSLAATLSSKQLHAAHGVLEDPLFCRTMILNPDGQVTAGRSMANAMQAPLRLTKEEHAAARMILAVHIDRHRDDASCLALLPSTSTSSIT